MAERVVASDNDRKFTHFEHMVCDVEVSVLSVRPHISTPPPSTNNGLKTTTFLENEWPTSLANYATISNYIVIVGDMDFHLNTVNDCDVCKPTYVKVR